MITIEICTELPSGFDSLVEQCLPIMEGGTIDWRYMGDPADDAAKKEELRKVYQKYIDLPDTRVLYWEKDGIPIHLAAGAINQSDDQYILWTYALYGKDGNGSKGWLFDPAYIMQTREFIQTDMGLAGYLVSCHKGSGLYDYHMSKVGASENYEVIEEDSATPEEAPEITVARIRYTYI